MRRGQKMADNSLQNVLNWLDDEIKSLKEEIMNRNEELKTLENLAQGLKELEGDSEYKEKYDELSKTYELEKERLLKLHNHFKKTEIDCENLRAELDGWKNWFSQNKDLFDRLLSVAPPDGKPQKKSK